MVHLPFPLVRFPRPNTAKKIAIESVLFFKLSSRKLRIYVSTYLNCLFGYLLFLEFGCVLRHGHSVEGGQLNP